MNKLTKITLGVATFLIMSGGLLALTGWIMGADCILHYEHSGVSITISPFGISGVAIGGDTNYEECNIPNYEYEHDEEYTYAYERVGEPSED